MCGLAACGGGSYFKKRPQSSNYQKDGPSSPQGFDLFCITRVSSVSVSSAESPT